MLKTITSFVDSLGSLTYKGLWNAATNTPTLASGVGTTGDYYVVSVPGTTTLDGISSWAAGDWAIFNGSVWEKYNNPADTLSEVLANGNTTAGTDISVTTGDDITFADNSKASFGAGSDLQIYHDSNDSYIKDEGTGNLYLTTDGSTMNLQAGSDNMVKIYKDAQVEISHDASVKLATTATGIDVTGSVTADGLVSSGDVTLGSGATLIIDDQDSLIFGTFASGSSGTLLQGGTSTAFDTYVGGKKRQTIAANGDISFYDDAAAQGLFWDSSESRLGLGTTTPDNKFVVSDAGGAGLEFIPQTSNDRTTLLSYDRNASTYQTIDFDSSDVHFNIAGSERLQIDSSGNLLVSDTTANPSGDNVDSGIALHNAGLVRASTNNAAAPLDLNIKGRDGIIADFRKDGTTVGSIGTRTGGLYIADAGVGFRFDSGGTDDIIPCDATGGAADASINLGSSGARFKDLHLSGGVYLGGTGAANLLDDYEEGTWTPEPARLTGGSITTDGTITATGSYTKVGRQVTLVCNIAITGTITQGTSNTSITGIPFLPITSPRHNASAICSQTALTNNVNDSAGISADYAYNALQTQNANPWVAGSLQLTCTYFTAA